VTGAKAQASIKADRGRLTDEDIDRMIADAERYRAQDEALAKKIHLRNALEEAVYRVKSQFAEKNDISGTLELDDILGWLEYDSEQASYEEVQQKAEAFTDKFGLKVEPISSSEVRSF